MSCYTFCINLIVTRPNCNPLLTGASGLVYAIRTTSPGSHHDSHVFRDSQLHYQLVERKWEPFDGAKMVADSAYKVSGNN